MTLKVKTKLDSFKTCMIIALENNPILFATYAMDDVDQLQAMYQNFVALARWVQIEILNIPEEEASSLINIPMTIGSFVAKTLFKYIRAQASNKDLFNFSMRKLGLLDTSDPYYRTSLKSYIHCQKKFQNKQKLLRALELIRKEDKDKKKKKSSFTEKPISQQDKDLYNLTCEDLVRLDHFMNKAKFYFLGINQGSVQYFSGLRGDSAVFSALVQGGRCNNENPFEWHLECGADIDLQSCYATALRHFHFPIRHFHFPIGLPTVLSFKPNQAKMTLQQFLASYASKNQLIDNMWFVTVNTTKPFSFQQDLVCSKDSTPTQINKSNAKNWENISISDLDRDDELKHIPGHFLLLRKELRNGIITSDILNVLLKVANNQEMKEIFQLEVVSAVMYLKKDKVNSLDEWIDLAIADKGQLYNKNGNFAESTDTRMRYHFDLSLEGFNGKLADARARFKKEKSLSGNAMQAMLKLISNATYGVIASPFFLVSNTVLANNITARARMGAWMLNKALHTRQSITDGGMYGLQTVPFLKEGAKLPGLDLLSDNRNWHDKIRYERTVGNLGGINWKDVLSDPTSSNCKNLLNNLDEIAKNHIQEFWKRYGLELPFQVEHKISNTFKSAGYFNKAHYCFITMSGEVIYKVRGAKFYQDEENVPSPMFHLLLELAENKEAKLSLAEDLEYDHISLLKIQKWVEAVESQKGFEEIRNSGIRPGDELREKRFARFNNTHMPCNILADFLRREKRAFKGQTKENRLFERFFDQGISKVVEQMAKDSLQEGKNKSNKNAFKEE
nr:hypothetical protein [Mesostigma viride]